VKLGFCLGIRERGKWKGAGGDCSRRAHAPVRSRGKTGTALVDQGKEKLAG
jgi:hypothetical protein